MAVNIKQRDDGTTSFHSEQLGKSVLLLGGSEQPVAGGSTVAYHGSSYLKVQLGTNSMTAGVLSVVNPFSEDVYVGRTFIAVQTGFGTTTAALSFGTGQYSTTFGNNLLDLVTATSSTGGLFDNITDKGTAGKSRQLWTSGYYITGTASCTPVTLTGYAYFEILRA